MNKFFSLAVALITSPMILAAAACSDDASAPAAGAPDASSDSDSSSPSSSNSGVDTGAVAVKGGLIAISGEDVAQAAFWEGVSWAEAQGYTCIESTEGPCRIADCSVSAEAAAGKVPKYPTAGEITVRFTEETITLGADANGVYSEQSRENTPSNLTGIEITAAGAEVPPFFSKALVPPKDLELTAPLADGDGNLEIDRAADLEVAWTVEADNTEVRASLSAFPSPTRSVEVSCAFDGTVGKGTIPAAALGKVPVVPTTSLQVGAVQTHDFEQGPWKIQTIVYGFGSLSGPTLK